MPGSIGILNVGAGDTKLVFDDKNPAEKAKSAQTVRDMIRKGFVLLIEIGKDEKGPIYRRAHDFDPDTAEYIIAGDAAPQEIITNADAANEPTPAPRSRRGRAPVARVAASSTNAVAVARTAGG